MAQLNPYLHFDGTCREAMTFCKECLGGDLALQAVGESLVAAQMPAEAHTKIPHATLKEEFFGTHGGLTDTYGIDWMLTCEKQKASSPLRGPSCQGGTRRAGSLFDPGLAGGYLHPMVRPRIPWLKFFGTWGLFLLLHFSYKTFPTTLFRVIGEQGEVTFFHMKMLFFAYLGTSLVEFLVRRRRIVAVGQFVSARLLVAVAYPWFAITLWFTAEALGIRIPVIPWEIIYANVFTAIGVYLALRLEEVLDAAAFRPALHALIGVVFAAALLSYVSFSLSTPQHFFTTPPG